MTVLKLKQASESLVVRVETQVTRPHPRALHSVVLGESLESAVLTGDVDPGLLEHLNQ